MSRFIRLSMLCAALIAGCVVTAADQPNIVLVMADDQGWGDMAYNGHPIVKTPNFDKAAATGLRFDRFYAAAPVCSPTRASVMTGRHPNRMGVFKWGHPVRPQETTIAEALKTVGYSTAHFGKWHLGSVRNASPVNPGKNGFDFWLSAPNFYDNDATLSRMGTAVRTKGESSAVAAKASIDWMREQVKSNKPFLSVVWFGSPHGPHQAIESDRKLYDDQPKKMQHFFGEITGMDRAFGMIRDELTKLGIRENTILWYCSDNGALKGLGSTGGRRNYKGSVYEGGLLVPAILEWPAKIAKPRVTKIRCNTCDIYPTLIEVANAEIKNQPVVDGQSLLPLISGKKDFKSKAMGFWDYDIKGIGTPSETWMTELLEAQKSGKDLPPDPASAAAADLPKKASSIAGFQGHSAFIAKGWKLHRIKKNQKVTWELYNLDRDPSETKDLMNEHPKEAAILKDELLSWLSSVAGSYYGKDY